MHDLHNRELSGCLVTGSAKQNPMPRLDESLFTSILALAQEQSGKHYQSNKELEIGRGQTELSSSFSGEQRRILPRRFCTARLRCHSLNKRLAVNGVILAAPASSSFVASNSKPPGTFCPMSSARQSTTPPSRSRAE